jgi:replicative DNA helicase
MTAFSEPVVLLQHDLPRSVEAEAAVLGGILVDNRRLIDVAGWLQPDHFAQTWCGLIYRVMLSLAKKNEPIEFVSVKEALGDGLNEVGLSRLAKLGDGVPRSTNVEYYARVVIDHARRREAILKATAVIESALDPQATADDVIARAQEAFFRLTEGRRTETMFSADEMTADLLKHFEELEQHGHEITGLPTGIRDLDTMTFGLQPGELVVVGARPSVGKTALALQIAMFSAIHAPVLFCSLEMSHRPVWKRALFNTARVDGFRYQRGHYAGDQSTYQRVSRALEVLSPLRLHLDEQPGMTSVDVRTKAQQVQLRHGLGLVVVDYLQLMRPSDPKAAKSQNRAQVVGEMAWDLKEAARTLGVPVIVLSQLRRRDDEKTLPTMADLRESGDIEAHADIVLLLHRKETREELSNLPVGEPSRVDLIVEKQRGNPTGVIQLFNYREQYRFAGISMEDAGLLDAMERAS